MSRRSSPSVHYRSVCPIACALDLVGDRWTLLILRDLFMGKAKYNEFLASPEGIPTNILAERLIRLQKAELIEKEAYQTAPPRFAYLLTEKGKNFRSVLGSLAMWGKRNLPGTKADKHLEQVLRGRDT